MNYALLYFLGIVISFVLFLASAKRGKSVEKHGSLVVALTCFVIAIAFPISWIFVFAVAYLEEKS